MAIRRNTVRLVRRLRRTVGSHADDTTRALTLAWVRAWDELSRLHAIALDEVAADAARLGRWPHPWELARIQSLHDAVYRAEQSLAALGGRTAREAGGATEDAIRATGDSEPAIIASQLPAGERAVALARFAGRITPDALDLMVARTATRITALTRPLSVEAVDVMRRELVRGVAVGANPRETAARMLLRVQGAFNGGLTRALTITRTETLDAYRAASRLSHMANADVLAGWVWTCSRDRRTCPSCIAMDGSEHPVSEPGPDDHQNGRCARTPLVKPWRDLGIGLTEPDAAMPDAKTWFNDLPEDDQVAIMGPARLDLLRSGRIGWDDLASRRTTTGWRDSYTPTAVRVLARRAA